MSFGQQYMFMDGTRQAQAELERAKLDLAEVIDECLFVENEKKRVEQELEASIRISSVELLLQSVQQMSSYVLQLEEQVVVPALGSLEEGLRQYTPTAVAARGDAVNSLDRAAQAANNSVSPLIAKVFGAMRRGPDVNASVLRRQQIVSGPPLQSLDDAYILCASMLASKQQLQSSLDDVSRTQGAYMAQMKAPVFASAADTAALAAANQSLVSYKAQVASMAQTIRLLEDSSRKQGVDGADTVRLTQKVRELESRCAQNDADRLEVAMRFETIQRALEAAAAPAVAAPNTVPQATHDVVLLQAQHQAKTIQIAQEEIATARRDLREAKKELEESKRANEAVALQHEEALHEKNDSIALLQTQLQIRSKEIHADDTDAFIRSLQRGQQANTPFRNDDKQQSTLQYQTKIRAFEMTISALNSELALLEDKIISIERRSDDDRHAAAAESADEKKRHREEMEECESVVQRMTTELEQLIGENGDLRRKLRQYSGGGR